MDQKDFLKFLKNARECQILGNYQESITDYQRAIEMAKAQMKKVGGESTLKGKWKMVLEALVKELSLAQETNEIKQSFKSTFEVANNLAKHQGKQQQPIVSRPAVGVEIVTPESRMVLHQQSVPVMQVNPSQDYGQPRIPAAERFGGLRPFEHH